MDNYRLIASGLETEYIELSRQLKPGEVLVATWLELPPSGRRKTQSVGGATCFAHIAHRARYGSITELKFYASKLGGTSPAL